MHDMIQSCNDWLKHVTGRMETDLWQLHDGGRQPNLCGGKFALLGRQARIWIDDDSQPQQVVHLITATAAPCHVIQAQQLFHRAVQALGAPLDLHINDTLVSHLQGSGHNSCIPGTDCKDRSQVSFLSSRSSKAVATVPDK